MKKILQITIAYCVTMLVLFFILRTWSGPIAAPQLVKDYTDSPRENTAYLLGDSIVGLAPYALPRFSRAGADAETLLQRIHEIPQTATNFHCVIMTAMDIGKDREPARVLHNLNALRSGFLARFPHAQCTVIDPYEIQAVVQQHPSIPFHPNRNGYALLRLRHPELW